MAILREDRADDDLPVWVPYSLALAKSRSPGRTALNRSAQLKGYDSPPSLRFPDQPSPNPAGLASAPGPRVSKFRRILACDNLNPLPATLSTVVHAKELNRIMRTGTSPPSTNRNWNCGDQSGPVQRLSQSAAVALILWKVHDRSKATGSVCPTARCFGVSDQTGCMAS